MATELEPIAALAASNPPATVFGEDYPIPTDLYIPPDALQVILQHFSGPLDLLLYLIKKQNIDILNIPIAHIAEQYNAYIEIMLSSNIDLASEYLVMATTLAHIKSRLLLPQPAWDNEDEDGEDPRRELVDRLLEYERFRKMSEVLGQCPRVGRDVFEVQAPLDPETQITVPLPEVSVEQLYRALQRAIERHRQMRRYSVGDAVTIDIHSRLFELYDRLSTVEYRSFSDLNDAAEGVLGVVVNFFSILCLWSNNVIELEQNQSGGEIYLRRSNRYNHVDQLRQVMRGTAQLIDSQSSHDSKDD